MLLLEIFEGERELSEYFAADDRRKAKNTIVAATYDEIMSRLSGKGEEWYRIVYRGKSGDMVKHLSVLKIDNWQDYFMHINMPMKWTLDDLSNLVKEVCRYNNRPDVEPVLRCTSEASLADDEVEVAFVVPKFDFGWTIGKGFSK